uniref:Proline-rich transmembrane protein 3/4 domain-containing protein n=1 Tax=Leptobrachium leishanense TaxID=445787 RepID=A0A8C5QMT5_9ANUR
MMLLLSIDAMLGRTNMALPHWTCIQILMLASLLLGSQEQEPTIEPFKPSNRENSTTPIPVWLQNNKGFFFSGSHEDGERSFAPTHRMLRLDSEELQMDMFLQGNMIEEEVSVQLSTNDSQPANKTLIETVTNRPLDLSTSQPTSSEWPDDISQSSAAFSSAVDVTMESVQDPTLNLEATLPYSVMVKNNESNLPTATSERFSLLDFISFGPTLQSVEPLLGTDSQELEVASEFSLITLTTHEEGPDENLVTEISLLDRTKIFEDNLESSTDLDEQLSEQMNEETSVFLTNPYVVTSDAVSPGITLPADPTALWDCDDLNPGNCNISDILSATPHEAEPTVNGRSTILSSPPIFITLHSDWNTSVADWGVAWEALVYGSVGLFGTVALLALLSIFCLVFRCPPGSFYFAVLHLLLISVSSSRAFALFYDAYGHQDRLPVFTAILLHDLAFPCMTSSFGIAFLLLSSRGRLQYSSPKFPRLCVLCVAVFLHFVVTAGAVVIVDLLQQFLFLLLVSRGVYVVLTTLLSLSFFVFYCLGKAQNTQIYDLKSSTPPTEYTSRCPFADSKDWNKVACTVLVSAFFGLLNSGLQLYAMLYALGYGGSIVFGPWPWWAFQMSSTVCEVGMCLPLAVVGAYPIFCANNMGRTNCWTKLFHLSPGHVTMKAPILASNSQWASSQHEKLICDTIVRSDSEFFPLYTLVEKRMSVGEELSLIYHSSKSLEVPGLSLYNGSKTPSFISVQMDSDSTVDFHPPSPINLRRSIDEALFSESLIPQSLFHGTALASSLSLTIRSATQLEDCVFKEKAADRGLYRTSSCMEIETGLPTPEPVITSTSTQEPTGSSYPGTWKGGESTTSSLCKMSLDGSSLVLCSSPEHAGNTNYTSDKKYESSRQSQGVYHTLSPPSQESLDVSSNVESNLRDNLIDVFGPIDSLSVASDTIDL